MGSCWPSAIVRGTSIRTRSPAASERRTSSPASGSMPMTRTSGSSAFAAVAQPAISPPPPTQTSSTSSGPASSISSSATVPWPAITRSSSYGWIGISPRSATSSASNASRSCA